MKPPHVLLPAASLTAVLLASIAPSAAALAEDRLYENAQVWTGSGFQPGTLAVRDGYFIAPEEAASDAVRVDLSGHFIVPPYANAHNHLTYANPAGSWSFAQHGVFYAWNPNTIIPRDPVADAAFFERTDSYDVRVSMGGITEPLGHPEKIYVEQLSQWVYQGWELEDFLGNAFHYGRTPAEIDASLDLLVEQGAEFVKTYLLYSEEYDQRSGDEAYYGAAGLNPENFPYLVEAAHARGLPVAVHVQTRADALTAARAGADMLAHLPAYSIEADSEAIAATLISAEDAREMAASGIVVVPTYGVSRRTSIYSQPDPDLLAETYLAQALNLQMLNAAGVPILTGSDGPEEVVSEIDHWIEIGGMDRIAAYNALFNTAGYLFPERAIGRFEPGYEASFLVLSADPMDSITALNAIEMRVKQGDLLAAPPSEEEGED